MMGTPVLVSPKVIETGKRSDTLVRRYYLNLYGWVPCAEDPLDFTDPVIFERWLHVNLDGEPVTCTLHEYCVGDWEAPALQSGTPQYGSAL
jgi:hypothetical protein